MARDTLCVSGLLYVIVTRTRLMLDDVPNGQLIATLAVDPGRLAVEGTAGVAFDTLQVAPMFAWY